MSGRLKLEFSRTGCFVMKRISRFPLGMAGTAFKRVDKRFVFVLLVLLVLTSAFAATPNSGTLTAPANGQTSSVSWSGGPYTGATADPSLCSSITCDTYMLTVNVPSTFYSSNPNYAVQVGLNWPSSTSDFDLYVYDSSGSQVCSSGQGNTNFEQADCGQLASGTYTVQVVAFAVVNSTYSGSASLGPEPTSPAGKARYKSGTFSFSKPLTLPGPDDLLFGVQGLEPRVKTDSLGNIYAAAIQGIPAGTDVWKSLDGGNSFQYLGQPDGAQAAAAIARGAGAGGGDEDLAIGNSGNVYVSSLWLGSATQSTSFNGGITWAVNPLSTDAPLVDRQWIASQGDHVLYLTYKQLGVLLVGTESVFVVKSFDGGLTFTLKLVYQAARGTSLVNVFPSLAIDQGGNLYIAFSDSHSAFLTSSTDHGATWTVPVRVSNGSGTKSTIGPWLTAGAPGKVNVTWWGTSAASNNDGNAQWKVFFAQSQNALAKIPTFAQTAVTGVMHQGAICTNGTGCASGTRNLAEYFAPGLYLDGSELIVFSDDFNNASPLATFTRQIAGATVNQK